MSIKTAAEVAYLLPIAETIKSNTSNKADDNRSKLLQFMEYVGAGVMATFVIAPIKAVSSLVAHNASTVATTETIRSIAREVISNPPALRQSISQEVVRSVPRGSLTGAALFLGHQAVQAYFNYRKTRAEEEGLKTKPQPVEYSISEFESDQSLFEEKQTKPFLTESSQEPGSSEGALYARYLESQAAQTTQPVRSEAEDIALLVSL
jgi:hypothetical protein